MTGNESSLHSAALTDVVFLVGLTPSSLAPISIAEMHLYAYLANLIALNRGVPVAEWGYGFSVTAEGFPFAHDLEAARANLIGRSIIRENDRGLWAEVEFLEAEVAILCAGQRPDQVGLSPTDARVRGVISKGGGNSSPAGVSR